MTVLFGSVKFYSEKGFGFISLDKPQDLFFHIKNYSKPVATERGVVFERVYKNSVRYPQPGDSVAFEMTMGNRGFVANPWCYTEDYHKALEIFEKWPQPQRYRVVTVHDQIHISGFVGEPHVTWGGEKGGTFEELCRTYPRDRYDKLQYFGHDDFNATHYIQQLKDGKWVNIEDPRPYVEDRYRSRRRW